MRNPGVDHLEGKPVASEAVMMVFANADASSIVSLRTCRYPTENTTWLWARIITPFGRWSRYDNYLRCSPEPVAADRDDATYSLADGSLVYRRRGSRLKPGTCEVEGRLQLFAESSGERETVDLKVHFAPRVAHAGYNPGRSEIMGAAGAEIRVGGKRIAFEGAGHFHEQIQDAARFMQPFTYASFWGSRVSGVTLFTANPLGGWMVRDGEMHRVCRFEVSAPSARRQVRFEFENGEVLTGVAELKHEHTIRIYGKPWFGHFVLCELAGESLPGMINDWCPADLPYLR